MSKTNCGVDARFFLGGGGQYLKIYYITITNILLSVYLTIYCIQTSFIFLRIYNAIGT